MNRFFQLVLIAIILLGCATTKITNSSRGKYSYIPMDAKEFDEQKYVDVNVSIIPLTKPPKKAKDKPKTFFDLRDSLPHSYLNILDKKTSNVQDLVNSIKLPLSDIKEEKEENNNPLIKGNEFQVRLWISNEKNFYRSEKLMHPNTRLEYLTTRISIQSSSISIKLIDKLQNELELIDMGSLERNNDVKFGSKLSGGLGFETAIEGIKSSGDTSELLNGNSTTDSIYDQNGNPIKVVTINSGDTSKKNSGQTNSKSSSIKKGINAELDYVNNESIKEQINVKARMLKTGYSFNDKQLSISQKGIPMAGIPNNLDVTMTLRFDDNNKNATQNIEVFSNLFIKRYEPNSADNIKINHKVFNYIPCSEVEDLSCNIEFEGAIRAVENLKRGRNNLEYDDKVIYYSFKGINQLLNPRIVTIDKFNFCNEVYGLITTLENREYSLRIDNKDVRIRKSDMPGKFKAWINALIEKSNKDLHVSDNIKMYFEGIDSTGNLEKVYLIHSDKNKIDINKLKQLCNNSMEFVTQ
jgi:hypothetical protein